MKSNRTNKIIPAVFIIIGCILAVLVVVRIVYWNGQRSVPRAKVVVPTSGNEKEQKETDDVQTQDNTSMTTFVPLLPTETLISTLSFDLNGDNLDDQVVAIRKESVPYLILLVGMYDAESNSYVRIAEIATNISRVRTFSYTGIDMTGDHKTELVYQGVLDNGDSVMSIYMCRRKLNKFELVQIGSFESDGTIFIQQDDRSESYELSQSKGESFPVWVYSSAKDDSGADNANLSQIQTEYQWNEQLQKYSQINQVRVTGSRIAAKELARIQDGTVETFADFLNGLWYKTSNENDGIRYLFFDYSDKEIIFLYQDTEEVYSWEDSNLRRSGIYLSTTNESITNMQRRCDISLAGIDEVHVHIIDDVRMIIKENNLWDGSYRKMTTQSSFNTDTKKTTDADYAVELQKGPSWISDNGMDLTFTDNAYELTGNSLEDKGIFVTDTVAGNFVIQFRSSSGQQILAESYEMLFDSVTIPATKKRKEETKTDYNTLHLTPIRISPDTCFPVEGPVLTLTRNESASSPRS
ncbi:MAG: pallilysin-related adhesin [Treponema sp.]|nr:pallilysin-related adhesin [Treponema sp.]